MLDISTSDILNYRIMKMFLSYKNLVKSNLLFAKDQELKIYFDLMHSFSMEPSNSKHFKRVFLGTFFRILFVVKYKYLK